MSREIARPRLRKAVTETDLGQRENLGPEASRNEAMGPWCRMRVTWQAEVMATALP